MAKFNDGLSQRNEISSIGTNNKITLNFSSLYNNKLHFGMNLNIHEITIESRNNFFENNYDTDSLVNYIDFNNDLFIKGGGFSVQLGLICLINKFRFGLINPLLNLSNLLKQTYSMFSKDVAGIFSLK